MLENVRRILCFLTCMSSTTRMKFMKFCVRIRPRSRKTKRAAFWVTTVLLCILVMAFNDATLQMMQARVNRGNIVDNEYILDTVNNRFPKAVRKVEEEPEATDLDIPPEYDPSNDLLPDLAPSTLHYVWCGSRHFEFKHYLALKSAVRVIKPDKVYFHFEELPTTDSEEYYRWFNQSIAEIGHLLLHRINDTTCHRKGAGRFLLIMNLLHKYGGIYTPEDAILVDFPVHLRSLPLVTGAYARTHTDFLEGLMVGKRLSFNNPKTPEELQVVMAKGREEHGGLKPCASEMKYNRDKKGEIICVTVSRELFPKDIWKGRNKFSTLSRVVMYGSRQIEPNYDLKSPIPRIAHYICLEDPFIKFTGYLSMLSSIYVAGFQKVFIHGPLPPQGTWWRRLSSDHRFVYVYREFPETESGEQMSVSMAIITMRVDILLKYGGVYNDHNVLWTQQVPHKLFGYSAVASPDWHMHGRWPESINHGTLMAKRNSGYLKSLRRVFQKFYGKDYWFLDHYLSYHEVELNPEQMFLNSRLQVKCLNHNCHPTWQGDYRSRLIQNKPGRQFSWQNDTMSLHWVDNFPELDADMVKYTSGIVVDVARAILKNAGINVMSV
ncbi:uncharacterized protein [Haliotis asinina]|uniref:uncharacterized protein isoform X1 n=1 Tax=Haliotis asinina TaxID=109174 RepID=UPI00353276E0